MKQNKITIIGAGIGGLTTAIALQKYKIDFEIYESFAAIKDVGAGIMLANNAMQVMKKLEIHEEITAMGNVFKGLKLRDPDMNCLTDVNTTEFSPEPIPTVAIHRSVLQQILLAKIPKEKLHFDKKLIAMESQGNSVLLRFKDGSKMQSEVIIGADGIHSVVRDTIYPNSQIRNANQNCWRGISELELPFEYKQELNEIWGRGCRFGFVQIEQQKVYWYALKDQRSDVEISKQDLLDLFESFDPIVNQLIRACPADRILNNPIKDLKPINKWYNKNTCLMGDAAHATTPNLGQGACQSIEDALALAACLAKESNYEAAFEKFQKIRMKKAIWVVKQSWRIGKLSHLQNKILVSVRNTMLKHAPKSLQRKQNTFLFKLATVD